MGIFTEVASAFDAAQGYATTATANLSGFTTALSTGVYEPKPFDLKWTTIPAPDIDPLPEPDPFDPVVYTAPDGAPAAFNEAAPNTTIDTYFESAPGVSFGVAPVISYGAAPVVPSVGAVAIPDATPVVMPPTPSYLALNTVSFAGLDVHQAWLDKLETIPTLTLVAPTPYSYARGPEYASTLLTSLKGTLNSRLAGGTGLNPAVEQAIWDRARDREMSTAQANEAEIMRQSEALGFSLPTGTLAAQLRESQQQTYDKLSTLSRDVSIKQAELEQENLKQTIAAGMQLEGQLIDYSYKLEHLTFESAKEYASNAVQIHNSRVDAFKALLSGYQTYAQAYDTIIKAESLKIEEYKAELQGEQTKASINTNLVEQYKATISAEMSKVEIYKAQVSAAQTLVQLESAKISAAGEQIKAYAATLNAETSKVEAYKASVQAEVAKLDSYRVKAEAFKAKVGAQGEKARADLARYTALSQSKAHEWESYKIKQQGEIARINAEATISGVKLDGYKAKAASIQATATMNLHKWDSNLKQYEAGMQLMFQTAKANQDALAHAKDAKLEAAKVGAQVYAQLTASAYSMIHASASISGSGAQSVSYSYSNDTSSAAPTVTAAWQ